MTDTPVEQLSFEQAIKELEAVVARLERGEVALDESIGLYERGAKLKARCEAKLKEAEEKVAKITFTSGSTGTPKGVCLARVGIERTAEGLADTLGDLDIQSHLCIMPLAMLLENIAGVYAPVLLGATIHVPPLAAVGLTGSSGLNVATLRAAIDRARAESVILTPQLLGELTASVVRDPWTACPLRFAAVGGAKLSEQDIDDALGAGIPAYQGYGLSECNSVVTLNRPSERRRGSVRAGTAHSRRHPRW